LIGCPRKPERPDPIDDDWCSLVTPAFGYWLVKPSLGMLLGVAQKISITAHYANQNPILTQLSFRDQESC